MEINLHSIPDVKYNSHRPSSRQNQTPPPNASAAGATSSDTPQSESSSVTNFIYKTILNSPKLFRRTLTGTPSTDESPMSVRSNSPYQKRHGLKLDEGVVKKTVNDNVTMSAPNTPGSKRTLLPRF